MLAGGDLGSSITCTLGSSYSHHCKAIHLNFVDVSHGIGLPHVTNPEHVVSLAHANLPLVNMLPLGMSQEEMGYLPALNDFMKFETGKACSAHGFACASMSQETRRQHIKGSVSFRANSAP